MPEDDFLIPRRSHTPTTQAEPCEPSQRMRIDLKVLDERRLRKKKLPRHPKSADDEEEPRRYLDRRIAKAHPVFEDQMWTLGDTARWIAERTREAVDGLSIDEERLFEILPEIQEALAAGEVRAWSHTPNDPVPRELPGEAWQVYQLAIEEQHGLLRILVLRSSSSMDEQVFRDIRLSRDDALCRWPDEQGSTPSRPVGTVGAEYRCRSWLTKMMKAKPERPQPKQALREKAKRRFPKLSNRGFERAWSSAVGQSGARKWSAPGRRS